MPWTTTEAPLPGVEIHACDAAGCRALARHHFLSIQDGTGARRVAMRCDDHAEEMREKISKRRVAAAPAPKIEQQVVDPIAELLEPKPAEKPKRPPVLFDIPDGVKPTTCTSCGASVFWILTRNMRRMPVDAFGETRGQSHFSTCPQADQHRRPRATTATNGTP